MLTHGFLMIQYFSKNYTITVEKDDLSNLPKTMKCPKCGKRVKLGITTCTGDFDMYCCAFATLPKGHRKPVGGKKFKRKERHVRKR